MVQSIEASERGMSSLGSVRIEVSWVAVKKLSLSYHNMGV